MEAKRIEGKPGKTKREKLEEWLGEKRWDKSAVNDLLQFIDKLDVSLDSSVEESIPDMYQVTMTEEQALWFTRIWPRGGSPFTTAQRLADVLREVMLLPRN